jgi:hypothetical protein
MVYTNTRRVVHVHVREKEIEGINFSYPTGQ